MTENNPECFLTQEQAIKLTILEYLHDWTPDNHRDRTVEFQYYLGWDQHDLMIRLIGIAIALRY